MESEENDSAVSLPSHKPWKSIKPIPTFPPPRRPRGEIKSSKPAQLRATHSEGNSSGTISSSNLLTLTSSVFAGNTAAINIQFPLTQNTTYTYTASGTAQITAGSSGTNCAISSATVAALYLAPYTATWTGNVTSGLASGAATLVVAEPITSGTTFNLNASGQFPATGTVSLSSSSCTFAPIALTGQVFGYTLQLNQSVSSSQNPIVVSATESTNPVTFNILIPSSSTVTCAAGTYSGTITQ